MPPLPRKETRPERLAINLFDLDHLHPVVRASALGGKLGKEAVRVDDERMDETAVEFTCDLLTAASVLDVLRSEARKADDPPIRAYIKKQGWWQRVPHTAVLTRVREGKVELSLEWFPPPALGYDKMVAPAFRPIKLGK